MRLSRFTLLKTKNRLSVPKASSRPSQIRVGSRGRVGFQPSKTHFTRIRIGIIFLRQLTSATYPQLKHLQRITHGIAVASSRRMAYRLKTFRVQFVSEPSSFPVGSPCRASDDVNRLARSIYGTLDADKEHFVLLAMNNKNRVNGFKVISTGSLTASFVHPREVWRAALQKSDQYDSYRDGKQYRPG